MGVAHAGWSLFRALRDPGAAASARSRGCRPQRFCPGVCRAAGRERQPCCRRSRGSCRARQVLRWPPAGARLDRRCRPHACRRGGDRRDPPRRRLGPRRRGLPAAGFAGRLRLRAVARQPSRCRDRPEPRHPEVRAPCPRRPRRAHLAQPQPRSQAAAARSRPSHRPGVQGSKPRRLSAVPAPAASAVRSPAPEIPRLEAGSADRAVRSDPVRGRQERRQEESGERVRDAGRAQDPRQHGGVALDAGVARRLLRLGQHPRVHRARHQGRQGDPHRARHRRQARYANAGLLAGHRAGDLPSVLGHPGIRSSATTSCRASRAAAPGSWSATTCAFSAAGATSIRRPSTGPAPISANSTSISRPVPPACWAS